MRLLALRAVHDHAAHRPLLEQGLVHAEIPQVGQQLRPLLRADGLLDGLVRGVERPRGVVRIACERVRWHRVFPHDPARYRADPMSSPDTMGYRCPTCTNGRHTCPPTRESRP